MTHKSAGLLAPRCHGGIALDGEALDGVRDGVGVLDDLLDDVGDDVGLILPGLVRLPMGFATVSAAVLLVVQIAALWLDLAAGSLGDLPVKAVVLALTLFILWMRLRAHQAESTAP